MIHWNTHSFKLLCPVRSIAYTGIKVALWLFLVIAMWKAFTSAVRDVLDEDAKYSSTPNSQQHHDGSGSGSGSNELHITRPQHLPSTTAAAAADSADSATMSPIQPQFPAPAAPHPSLRSASTIPSSSAAAPAASSYATARLPPLPAAAAPAEVSKPNALSSKEEEINGPPGPPSSQPAAQYKEEAGPSHSAQARPPAPGSDAVDWKARYSSLERSFLRLQSQLRDALTDQQETEAKLMATERTLEDVRFSKQQVSTSAMHTHLKGFFVLHALLDSYMEN